MGTVPDRGSLQARWKSTSKAQAEAEEIRARLGTALSGAITSAGMEILLKGFVGALRATERVRQSTRDLGDVRGLGQVAQMWSFYALTTGDASAAFHLATEGEQAARQLGSDYARRTAAAILAESLTVLRQIDKAQIWLTVALGADPCDVVTHVIARRAAAQRCRARSA